MIFYFFFEWCWSGFRSFKVIDLTIDPPGSAVCICFSLRFYGSQEYSWMSGTIPLECHPAARLGDGLHSKSLIPVTESKGGQFPAATFGLLAF